MFSFQLEADIFALQETRHYVVFSRWHRELVSKADLPT